MSVFIFNSFAEQIDDEVIIPVRLLYQIFGIEPLDAIRHILLLRQGCLVVSRQLQRSLAAAGKPAFSMTKSM